MNCYSRGSILAPIMIVGEGPGRDEVGHKIKGSKDTEEKDQSAPVPFVGPAGRLMQSLLEFADIQEGDYIMTNVVKFFPSENGRTRRPTEEEIKEEISNLHKEICAIKPKVVIAVGGTSYWALVKKDTASMKDTRISEANGKVFEIEVEADGVKHKTSVLPIYHPAAVLRSAGEKKTMYKKEIAAAFVKNQELLGRACGRPLLIQ